jgi:hypothetical protein
MTLGSIKNDFSQEPWKNLEAMAVEIPTALGVAMSLETPLRPPVYTAHHIQLNALKILLNIPSLTRTIW